jgi:hypothetical protein
VPRWVFACMRVWLAEVRKIVCVELDILTYLLVVVVVVVSAVNLLREEKPTRCHWMVCCTYNMLNMFRALLCHSSGARDYMCVITAYGARCLGCWLLVRCSSQPVAWMRSSPHPGYRPATSWVHYTTSCKHSLVLLKMGEIISRNMLSWLELVINHYYCN